MWGSTYKTLAVGFVLCAVVGGFALNACGSALTRPQDDLEAWKSAKSKKVVWLNPYNHDLSVEGIGESSAIPYGSVLVTDGPDADSIGPSCSASMTSGMPPLRDTVVGYKEFTGPAEYEIPESGYILGKPSVRYLSDEDPYVWEFSSTGCMTWKVKRDE